MIDLIAKNKIEKKILSALEGSVKTMGFDIIKIRYVEDEDSLLQIFIDNENSTVRIDDCGKVSKKVSLLLGIERPIEGDYRLEISSPGIERPLTKLSHLEEFIGHKIYVKTQKKFHNRDKFKCKLLGFSKNEIFIEEKNVQRNFSFGDIIDIELRPEI